MIASGTYFSTTSSCRTRLQRPSQRRSGSPIRRQDAGTRIWKHSRHVHSGPPTNHLSCCASPPLPWCDLLRRNHLLHRVRHGELLPITSRKILCWHFAPMAETTHTSGSRLSALPCPQVYRGSGDCVYQGVRSIMACEDGSSDRIHGLPLETPRTANVLLRIMRARPHARRSATAISQQSQAMLHNNKKHRQNNKKLLSWVLGQNGVRPEMPTIHHWSQTHLPVDQSTKRESE